MAVGKDTLQTYAAIYDPDRDFDANYTRFTARRIAPFLLHGQQVLELGCATSLMTSLLASPNLSFQCVEQAEDYLALAKARELSFVTYHRSRIEEFVTDSSFDHILMTNLIHELTSPQELFVKTAKWLLPGGKLHVTIPNPESIHRKVAQLAGLIRDTAEVSARGEKFLTLKLYRNGEVVQMAAEAGLKEVHRDGILLKPLANAQMEGLDKNVLEAFDKLAHEFVEHSAMTYFVFTKER